MFKIGCAEKILEVPLFTELYGHGPFHGRRCQGERDAFASGTPDPEYLKIFGAAMPETEMPFIPSRKKKPENSLPSTRSRKNSSGFMRYCHMLTLEFKFVDTIADFVVKNSLRLEK